MDEQETAKVTQLEKSSSEILSLVDEHLRSKTVERNGPPWTLKLERWLRYLMMACGAVIFAAQFLHWLGAIELSPALNPILKWLLIVIVLIALPVTWLYILLVFISAMWQVASKPFRLLIGGRCRADGMLISKLARFDEAALLPLTQASCLHESLFEGRRKRLLGFLDKVPIPAVMLFSALALQVQAVTLPAGLSWINQFSPTPITGTLLAILGGLFTLLTMQMHYGQESIRAYAAYLSAALEYKKTLIPAGTVVVQDQSVNEPKHLAS